MAAEWNVSRGRLSAEGRRAFEQAQVNAAITEFDRIDGARRSSKAMKVIGTISLFALGATAAAAAIVASGGILAAPTAAAVMVAAEGSGALAGVSAVLAGVGIGREAFNKRQLKKVQETYALAA